MSELPEANPNYRHEEPPDPTPTTPSRPPPQDPFFIPIFILTAEITVILLAILYWYTTH